jgi:hypothetical protein
LATVGVVVGRNGLMEAFNLALFLVAKVMVLWAFTASVKYSKN